MTVSTPTRTETGGPKIDLDLETPGNGRVDQRFKDLTYYSDNNNGRIIGRVRSPTIIFEFRNEMPTSNKMKNKIRQYTSTAWALISNQNT